MIRLIHSFIRDRRDREREMGDDGDVPTSSILFAVRKHAGRTCASHTAAFLACKRGDQDPETCLREGAALTGCLVDALKDLKSKCGDELNGYAACLDYRSNNFEKCRKEQAAFENTCTL